MHDFRGKSLRGRSFKNKDLKGANFSHADIRGINFADANLRDANFSNARAGLQKYLEILLVSVSLLFSALSGAALQLGITPVILGLSSRPIYSSTTILLLIIFFTVTACRGIAVAVLTCISTTIVVIVVAAAVTFKSGTVDEILAGALAGVITIAEASFGIIAISVAGAVAVTLAGILAVPGIVISAISSAGIIATIQAISRATAIAMTLLAVIATLIAVHVAMRALAGDQACAFIRLIAVALSTVGGTNFRGANLTDADFTQATLKSTDLRKAILIRTRWFQTQKLDCARLGDSYLKYPQVQQLVTTGWGQDQNFDRLPLSGINLKGANLTDASFIGTDLNHANLQDADLSRAVLKQTQLDGADLTRACLTGAYLEDWGITGETKLDGVRCKHIYMHVPAKDDPDPLRKPDNRQEDFADGDFADFIKPIVDTLDLYHNQGVDPRAIAIAFKNLAENNPEAELEIVAMEKRGRDKFLLRAKTAKDADKSKLSAEYFSDYNQLKALPENHVRLLLAEKDSRIQQLENMVMTALKRPSFYAGNYYNQGDTMSENSGINIQGSSNVSNIAGGGLSGFANLGTINDNVTIALNQLPDSSEPDKPSIKELLTQLQAAIQADTNLTEEDKAEALEQVKALAEAGKNHQQEAGQKAAKTAMKILKGTVAGLPSAAALVEACNKLLPAIASLLGLA